MTLKVGKYMTLILKDNNCRLKIRARLTPAPSVGQEKCKIFYASLQRVEGKDIDIS